MIIKENKQPNTASRAKQNKPVSNDFEELIQNEFQPVPSYQRPETAINLSSAPKMQQLQRTFGNQAVGRLMRSNEGQDRTQIDKFGLNIPRINLESQRNFVQRYTGPGSQDVFFRSGIKSQHQPSNNGLLVNILQGTSDSSVVQRGIHRADKPKEKTPQQKKREAERKSELEVDQNLLIINRYYNSYKSKGDDILGGITGAYYGPPKRSLNLRELRLEMANTMNELVKSKIVDSDDQSHFSKAQKEQRKTIELSDAIDNLPRRVKAGLRSTGGKTPLSEKIKVALNGQLRKEKETILEHLDSIYLRHLDHFGEKWDALIADQYEDKAPHPNAAANPGNYHTGDVGDPIPIMWYKAPQDYANVNGRSLTQAGSVKVGNHTLGVSPHNIPKVNWIIQKAQSSGVRGNQVDFNKSLVNNGFPMNNLDGDHVLDLGFGGQDTDDNYWPLNSTINRRAFNGYNKSYVVHYRNNMNQVKAKAIGGMVGRWFVVKGFLGSGDGPIPTEASTENAGKV